jgi:hypothetical protein
MFAAAPFSVLTNLLWNGSILPLALACRCVAFVRTRGGRRQLIDADGIEPGFQKGRWITPTNKRGPTSKARDRFSSGEGSGRAAK